LQQDEPVQEYDLWEPGLPVVPGPRDRDIKRGMRYLVAYDICEPSRLRRVALCCQDFGTRVQKSVFECDLEPHRFEVMWAELNALIDPEEDYLTAYPICQTCHTKTYSSGKMVRPEKFLAYLI